MLRFHFMRHGATEPNLRGVRCGGDIDAALTDLGREQVRSAAERMRVMHLPVGRIIASGLARARESATIVSEVLGGVPITIEPLLDERQLGEWNGLPIAETQSLLVRNVTPPGGESEERFVARVAAALGCLEGHLADEPIVLSSNGVGRVLHTLLGGAGRLSLANGEIVQFVITPDAFRHDSPRRMPKLTARPLGGMAQA